MDKMPSFEELNKVEKEKIEELEIPEVKPDDIFEGKLEQESNDIKNELEKMPAEEREKIGVGLRNFGFFAKELKSQAMAWIFENAGGDKKEAQEAEGFTGSIKRWAQGWAQSYRKDETIARKNIEQTKELDLSLKQVGNVGFITGEAMKYGRTVADVVGWTAGSPLRYVMFGAQIFSRGAEAAKEARLMNTKVIDKTRIQDMDEAAEEAWKIYENAQTKAEEKGEKVSKQNLEKSYVENLPEDLLKRLEKSEPGMATGILQRVLKKDLEFAIKHGKVNETRLKEYDKMISQYGEIDALAMGAKYAETAGKAIVAGVQIETAVLLFQRMPEMINKLMELGSSTAYGNELPEEILKGHDNIEILKGEIVPEIEVKASVDEKLMELATIKKSEGIGHALIRQLSADPEKFGFKGNAEDLSAVKSWAGGEAHRIATEGGYVDSKTGAETWVRHSENPTRVILQDDKTIEIEQEQNLYKASESELKRAADYREHLGKPKITSLTPEKMAEMADKEYIIEESYSQRIAEQERLKEIKRAEMREKLEYYDEKYNEQERLKGIQKEIPAIEEMGPPKSAAQVEEVLKKPEVKTEVLPEKPIEKPEAKSEILGAKVTEEQSKIDQSWTKGLSSVKEYELPGYHLLKELDKDLELVEKGIFKKQPEISNEWTKGLFRRETFETPESNKAILGDKEYAPELSTKIVTYEDLVKGDKDVYKKFIFANDRQGGIFSIGNNRLDDLDLENDLNRIYYNTKIPVDKKIEILAGIKKVLDEEVSSKLLNFHEASTFRLLSKAVDQDIKRLSNKN